MNATTTFDRLMAALQDAAFDPARWPVASALVDEVIGATGNSLVVGDGEDTDDVRIFITGLYKRGERRRDFWNSCTSAATTRSTNGFRD